MFWATEFGLSNEAWPFVSWCSWKELGHFLNIKKQLERQPKIDSESNKIRRQLTHQRVQIGCLLVTLLIWNVMFTNWTIFNGSSELLHFTARKWKGFMCSTILTQFVYLLKMAINFLSLDKSQNPLMRGFW